ncbi:hypothetical protein NN561_012897 [Cricetulus griseus]
MCNAEVLPGLSLNLTAVSTTRLQRFGAALPSVKTAPPSGGSVGCDRVQSSCDTTPTRAAPVPTGPSSANGTVPVVPADMGRWRYRHALQLGSQGRGLPAPPPCPAFGHAHSGRAQPASAFWLEES